MKVIGIDIGFGFTKATNGRDAVIFKSIFGEASEFNLESSSRVKPDQTTISTWRLMDKASSSAS